MEVDKQTVFSLKMGEIRKLFEAPRKRPLHLVIQRDADVMDFYLDMRSPI